MSQIDEKSKLKLNFSIRLKSGEIIDTNMAEEPIAMEIGDGNMLPGFEQCLLGLTSGDVREFEIPAADAFGDRNENNIQRFAVDNFSHIEFIELGTVIDFDDAAETHRPGVVVDMDSEFLTIDFNHPLSGHDLLFEVKICSVKAVEVKA